MMSTSIYIKGSFAPEEEINKYPSSMLIMNWTPKNYHQMMNHLRLR